MHVPALSVLKKPGGQRKQHAGACLSPAAGLLHSRVLYQIRHCNTAGSDIRLLARQIMPWQKQLRTLIVYCAFATAMLEVLHANVLPGGCDVAVGIQGGGLKC